MLIWMNVDESKPLDVTKGIVNKEIALDWLLAFVKAIKYYFRYKEDGKKDEKCDDLSRLISNIKIDYDNYLNPDNKEIPLPMVISLRLLDYLRIISEHKKADEKTINVLYENLDKINSCFTDLEKVIRFHQPLEYSTYISQTVWIYCLALPFQFVTNSGWVTIPIVFFMTFILFGAHKIGLKFKCPFKHENDLGVECVCE